jgi:cyclopropane-fatty-acyl-phospholipid synthase
MNSMRSIDSLASIAAARGSRFIADRLRRSLANLTVAVMVELPGGERVRCGNGAPVAEVKVKTPRALWALASFDELRIAEAFMEGDLDLEGDLLALMDVRSRLGDRHYLQYAWRFLNPLLFGQVRLNSSAIRQHYDLDADFYLSFMDETRCYTQGIFQHPDEKLADAIRRKFDFCIDSCRLGPGSHILEIGPGWGAFSEYVSKRGVRLTAVTNSIKSHEYMTDLGRRLGHDWEIVFSDFLEYQSPRRYDAVVLMGIMEHLPDYDGVVERFLKLLKPGGHVYFDASAIREKYKLSSFTERYIYPGNHSFLAIHAFLAAAARTPIEVLSVHNDRESYFLTFRHWAEEFQANRDKVIERFGVHNYRRFFLYLWGATHAFKIDDLQCWRVVMRAPQEAPQGVR